MPQMWRKIINFAAQKTPRTMVNGQWPMAEEPDRQRIIYKNKYSYAIKGRKNFPGYRPRCRRVF